jgi:hypothetical protein
VGSDAACPFCGSRRRGSSETDKVAGLAIRREVLVSDSSAVGVLKLDR